MGINSMDECLWNSRVLQSQATCVSRNKFNQIPIRKMSKQEVEDQIRNFIEYAYSDDADRQRMFNVLEDYINEMYETWYELNAIVSGAELSELTRAVNTGELNGRKSMETIYKIANSITKQIR
jgi:hypothetical protein